MRRGETVTRLRGTEVEDGYGGVRFDFTDPDELDIVGCGVAPLTAEELRDRGRQGTERGWTVYGPHGADVEFTDRVRIRGEVFEVEGGARDWESPHTGRRAGSVFAAFAIDG